MGSRPTRMPRFAWSESADLVEPVSSIADNGFPAGYRPPAQWINYLLHFAFSWVDHLRGPGWGAWTREDHAAATSLTAVAGIAVDRDETRSRYQRVRYAIVGTQSGPAGHIITSRNGRVWTDRSAPTSSTALYGITCIGDTWYTWGEVGAGVNVWSTPADTGSNSSAVRTGTAGHWTTVAALAGTELRGVVGDVAALARVAITKDAAGTYAIAASADSGATWPYLSAGSWTSGSDHASDIVYDDSRARFLIASMFGEVKRLGSTGAWVAGAATLGSLSGIATDARVHLRVGGPEDERTLLAWASHREDGTTALSASKLWRTEDGGTTWSAITLPEAMRESSGAAIITDVCHVDGTWIATTSAAPYLWRSDDDGQTWERLPLPIAEESSWALSRAVYADGQILATGLTWTVTSSRASATSPGTWTSREPTYLADAGYLRGRRIHTTAPSDGQVYAWNASTSRFEPVAPSSLSGLPWWAAVPPDEIATSDATVTTLATISAATDHLYTVDVPVSAREAARTFSVAWKLLATVSSDGAAATVVDVLTTGPTDGGASGCSVTIDTSGTDIRVRVTGLGGTSITWGVQGTVQRIGS